MQEEIVFVYGTLRKNLPWHHLLKTSSFLGEGKTKEKFALYADNIPFVFENNKISNITGELYQVDSKILKILDSLEGHPNWYCRKKTTIISKDKEIESWLYFYPKRIKGLLIDSGDYLDYFLY